MAMRLVKNTNPGVRRVFFEEDQQGREKIQGTANSY
jgi:hypothetical protein